ncbi:MAG: DUF1566 domain-containing protein [Patescibacteria group bacterium]
MTHGKKFFVLSLAMFFIGLIAIETRAATIAERLGGHILLQVEEHGEAWYVDPDTATRHYLGRPADAFELMRAFGLGIEHGLLMDYVVGRFPARLAGKIMLDVHWNGEAYYVNPDDLHGYYLGRPGDAFLVMRQLGLGISNLDLAAIPVGAGSGSPPADVSAPSAASTTANYRLVDTSQSHCFDDGQAISCPADGEFYFGQDAQYLGHAPSYTDHTDGTITDNVTGLMWQAAHNSERVNLEDATLTCDWLTLAGYYDWRLPTIKELYSLSDWRGLTGEIDFIDHQYFALEEPNQIVLDDSTLWPGMMGQTWSSTLYKGDLEERGEAAAFYFNFLDGHIKAAGTADNELFYRCVRGPQYGVNDFTDNGDGTISDRATSLTWQQTDDNVTRDWVTALAYCENLELADADDWRLPNVKELQSIVNYDSPEPAKYNVFGQSEPSAWFWSSTTYDYGGEAAYVCFGQCDSVDGVDVHGAGAQRSDPKSGHPADYATGRGGQANAVRINQHVRCVRGGSVFTIATDSPTTAPNQPEPETSGDETSTVPLPPAATIAACENHAINDRCSVTGGSEGRCAYHDQVGLFCQP